MTEERRPNFQNLLIVLLGLFIIVCIAHPGWAQSGLEGRINQTITGLVRIINVLIVGFVAWAGFLIAKGDGSGFTRLIYGVVGLVVANTAYLIINYFM